MNRQSIRETNPENKSTHSVSRHRPFSKAWLGLLLLAAAGSVGAWAQTTITGQVSDPHVINEDSSDTITPADLTISYGGGASSVTTLTLTQVGSDYTLTMQSATSWLVEPDPDFFGTATVDITVTDDMAATSATYSYNLDFAAVNDAPSFTAGSAQTTLEDSGTQTVAWATLLNKGASNESAQTLTFNVSVTAGGSLLTGTPTISGTTGNLSYTPAANANGVVSLSIYLSDSGGTSNGGDDTSATVTTSITITAVNDAPSFTQGADISYNGNPSSQTVAAWATAISAGPSDESSQTLTFAVTGITNSTLFDATPTVSAVSGNLVYNPAAGASGTSTLTLLLSDSGGTSNGGVAAATPITFTITIGYVNTAPSFTSGSNQTDLEDDGVQTVSGWATSISDGDSGTQSLSFSVTGNSNSALFSVAPAVNASTGTLTYTLADDANGSATISLELSDDGGTANGGSNTSTTHSFTISVTAVNDEPTFTAGADISYIGGASAQTYTNWATNISAGPSNESGQTLTFAVTSNSNSALFATAPSVNSSTGTLTFTPAVGASGTAIIGLQLSDNGGTTNGGDNSSSDTFSISITIANSAPSFSAGANVTVLEDAGAQTVQNWATSISDGDSGTQTLTFNVTSNSNSSLFSVSPAISASTGNLTFTPASNANGSADITVTLSDNGGTSGGGSNTSASATFTITVTAVNDPPSFTIGASQTVQEDAVAQEVLLWATAISAGPSNETQTVAFSVTGNTNTGLFSAGPAVDATGTLTFTPAANVAGSATISLVLTDNGGTTNGGLNSSSTASFNITVTPVNDPPSISAPVTRTATEDTPFTISLTDLTVTDPDTLSFPVGFSLYVREGSDYTRTNVSTSAVTIVPALDFSGTLNVVVFVSDGLSNSADFTIAVAVAPVNDAPVITGQLQNLVTPQETAITIPAGVLDVTDPDNTYPDDFTMVLLGGTGYSFTGTTVTPNVGVSGAVTVNVRVNDGQANSNTFGLLLTVTNILAPTITGQQPLSTTEETALTITTSSLLVNDPNRVFPTGYTVSVFNGSNYTTNGPIITPSLDYNGTLLVPVAVTNGTLTSTIYTLSVAVTPVNDAPIITHQNSVIINEDSSRLISLSDLVVSDPDSTYPTAFTLTVLNGTGYTVSGNTILPTTNTNGTLIVPVTVFDGFATSPQFGLNVTVNPINDAPVIRGQLQGLTTVQNQSIAIPLEALDVVDPDNTYPDDFSITALPGSGYSFVGGTITPNQGVSGSLPVQVRVNDGVANSNVFTLAVTVTNSSPPTITGQLPLSTPEDTALTVATSSLIVSDPLSQFPTGFTLNFFSGQNYSLPGGQILPDLNYFGTLTVPCTVSNGTRTSAIFNLTVTVTAVNDAPVITSQNTVSTAEDTPRQIQLTDLIVSDPDNSYPAGFTLNVQSGTSYSLTGNTLLPAANFNGTLLVPVTVFDGAATSATFNINVTVSPVNDAPVILNQIENLDTGIASPIVIPLSVLDVRDPDNTYPDDFTLAVLPGASYSFIGASVTPNASFTGTLQVQVRVNDGNANSNVAVVSITVTDSGGSTGVLAIVGQYPINIQEDTSRTFLAGDLIVNDPNHNWPTNFTLTVRDGDNYIRTSTTTIRPDTEFNGLLSVPVSVSDGTVTSNNYILTVVVEPVNDPPLITGQNSAATPEDTPRSIVLTDLLVSDPDDNYPTGFTLTVSDGVNYSRVGSVITPNRNFNGVLSVPCSVSDGDSTSNIFLFNITVNPVNDVPVILSQTRTLVTRQETPLAIALSDLTVSDPDNTYPDDFTLNLQPGANYTFTGNTIVPISGYIGPLLVQVRVNDGISFSAIFVMSVEVTSGGSILTITGQNPISGNEDTQIPILPGSLIVNDPTGQYPSGFTVTVADGNNYVRTTTTTILPTANYNGPLSVPVTVTTGLATSNVFTLNVIVDPVNDIPVITSQNQVNTQEDTPRVISLNDVNVTDPDNLFPSQFSLTVLDGQNYSHTGNAVLPMANFTGALVVNITVFDGTSSSASFPLTMSVIPTGDAPLIQGQNPVATLEDTPIAMRIDSLIVFDPDTTPDSLALTLQSGPNYTLNGLIITPATNFTGTLQIPLTVSDGTLVSNIFVLNLNVTPVNDAPIIISQGGITIAEDANRTIALQDLIVNDPDNVFPIDFTLFVLGGDNYTLQGQVLTPRLNYTGNLTVPVRVNDGLATSNVYPLTVTVTPVNDPPTIVGNFTVTTPEDTPRLIELTDLVVNDPDDAFPADFTLAIQNGPNYTRQGNNIIPEANFVGTLSVGLTVNDGQASSPGYFLEVGVTPVNDPPTITGQNNLSMDEDTTLLLDFKNLIVSDPDDVYPVGFSLTILDGLNYTHTLNTVTPLPNFSGILNVPVVVNDGVSTSAPFSVSIFVNALNDPPLITGQSELNTREDTPITLTLNHLLVNDPDNTYPSGFAMTLFTGSNYTLSGTVVTPRSEFSGQLFVPVTVNDGQADSPTFNIVITVSPFSDAPLITSQEPISIQEDSSRAIEISDLVVTDPDTPAQNLYLTVYDGVNYTHIGNTVVPTPNYSGPLIVPITVNDGVNASNLFNLRVTVDPGNDVPTIISQSTLTTREDTALIISLANLTITDPDGTGLGTLSLELFPGANYTVSGTSVRPTSNYFGFLQVPVRLREGNEASAVFNLLISVTPVNDVPTIKSQNPLETARNTPITIQLTDVTVVDFDNPPLSQFTLSVANGPNYTRVNNTVTPNTGFSGVLTVPVTVHDGEASSAPYPLQITVTSGSNSGGNPTGPTREPGLAPIYKTIQLDSAAYSVGEAEPSVVLTLVRTDDGSKEVQAKFTTEDGSALDGDDYEGSQSTISFAAGDFEPKHITIPIIEDELSEYGEFFGLVLGETGTKQSTTPARSEVAIFDDENMRPETRILTPVSGSEYLIGDILILDASGSDPQNQALSFNWEICGPRSTEHYTTQQAQVILLNDPGLYHISCYAKDSTGLDDPTQAQTTVEVLERPRARVSITEPANDKIFIHKGETVNFKSQAGPYTQTQAWYFLTNPDTFAVGSSYSKRFDEPGTYTLVTKAIDFVGQTATDWVTIEVNKPGEREPSAHIDSPSADQTLEVGEAYFFSASWEDPDAKGQDASFYWDLGDGRLLEGRNLQEVVYDQPGHYRLSFNATRGNETVSEEITIHVQGESLAPVVDLAFPNDLVIPPGGQVFFQATTLDNRGHDRVLFNWEFGDGRSSRQETPGFVSYNQAGTFVVSLYGVSPSGVRGRTVTRRVIVAETIEADLLSLKRSGSIGPGSYAGLTLNSVAPSDTFTIEITKPGQTLAVKLGGSGTFTAQLTAPDGAVFTNKLIENRGQVSIHDPKVGVWSITVASNGSSNITYQMDVSLENPSLTFPNIIVDENLDIQLGLVNPIPRPNSLQAIGYDATGNQLDQKEWVLPAYGRISLPIAEMFPNWYRRITWVKVVSQERLAGYVIADSRDGEREYAVNGIAISSDVLYAPHIAQDTNVWYTRAAVVNSSPIGLEADLDAGAWREPLYLGNGFSQDRFDFLDLFGGSLPQGATWAEFNDATGQPSLAGVEVFATTDGSQQMAGLEFVDPEPTDGAGFRYGNTLYFSHIARDVASFWTGLALVNVARNDQTLTLKAFGSSGQLVGQRALPLRAGEKFVANAEAALAEIGPLSSIDWLQVDAEDKIAGFELFGTIDGTRLAGLETAADLRFKLNFPFFDSSGQTAHGIALLNPNPQATTLTITLYDNTGIAQAVSQPITLSPNVKLVQTIANLFPNLTSPALPGWLAVNADAPITGFELMLSSDGRRMSAVLAQ